MAGATRERTTAPRSRASARLLTGLAAGALALTGCTGASDLAGGDDPADGRVTTSPTGDPTAPGQDSAGSPGGPVVPDADTLRLGRSDPVEDPYYPDTSNPEIDVLHYFLDLDWDGSVLTGEATVTFRPTEDTPTIRLDLADDLAVDQVALDGEGVDHVQFEDGLTVETGDLERSAVHTLTIDYAGSPRPTPAPSLRSDMTEGLGWSLDEAGNVYTFQEPYGAFTWYPVNDHPSDEALYDARITTYDGDVAVFNGERVEHTEEGDAATSVWHVAEPMASYVVTIAIGPYREYVDATPGGFRISYWLLPEDRDLLRRLRADGDAALPWLVDKAGPYPFASLGVVVVGGASAMETQTMVTMSRGAVLREDAVLLHEFAHMWFGNSVSPRDWQALWLNEGWAMYLQQWFERDTGRYRYGGGIASWRPLDDQARRLAGPPGDYDPGLFGDSNVYLGPALMLDAIRQRVGDRTFERLVRAWAAEHENATVDRADFTTWVEQQTGQELSGLIDRWLDAPTTPR